jgi:hypothetical protein
VWRPRWAPNGTHIAYESGRGDALRTRIATVGDTVRTLAELTGAGLAFSADSRTVAYLAPRGAGQPPRVRTRNVETGQETDLNDGGLIVTQLEWGSDGTLFAVAANADQAPSQIVAWRAGSTAAPTALTRSDSAKTNLVVVSGGRYVMYAVTAGGAGGRGGRAGGGGGGRGGAQQGGMFEVFDVASGTARQFAGRNVAVARNGSALVYLAGGGLPAPNAIMRLPLAPLGEPQQVYGTALQIQAPAIAPDGSRIAFQQMLREDWEIMTIAAGDSVPRRVTHEIQHDIAPAFLAPDKMLGLIGEARHRRSYMYDLGSMERTRLFHNNSVRTISPEYEWVPSPDGRKLLIVAERDGDTVTPHRFLYCMDLGTPVTRLALIARVDSALTAERALRALAAKTFAPIDAAVKAATSDVDVSRIYDYAQTLFSFDTKFWSQPGNKKAREYLMATYQSFGYANTRFMPFNPPAGRGGGGRGAAGAPPAAGPVETANVIAVLPGTESPDVVYVVGSHFDSVLPGAGADDNSSGTTALLEAARVLAKRPQPATIVFVSFTGEEGGLLGSREFVRRMKDSMNIVGALNNDMIGFANDQRLDNTIRYSNPGIRDIQHGGALRYSNLITYDAFYYKSTDAAAFYDQYGDIVGGIGSYPVLGNPHYHQPHDVLETINQQLVAEVSKTTVATLMMLASSPSRLTGLEATRSPAGALDVKWNASPENGIVRYLVSYRAGNIAKQVTVTAPTVRLTDAPAGTVIQVKAVNRRGMEGWDWARVTAK